MNTTPTNGTKLQLTQSNLSCFLISCQMIGIEPGDFETMMHIVVDHVIDGADEESPTRELKKPLLFLRAVQNFLIGIKAN